MSESRKPSIGWMMLATALSLSVGWGIRGNFGHEYGAMIPGALAALAAIMLSGRSDWFERAAYFGMFGALGWSFGGSMSYMQVIGYTHSGHLPSQVYGFACLGVLGFAWGAFGGMGTALPACLDRDRLTGLFPPLLAVFAAWFLQDLLIPYLVSQETGDRRHESLLYWYDTDWVAALIAIPAVVLLAVVRRRFCWGTSLVLHMAVGWWVGFLTVVLMVDGLGIEFRMTPPRGDNWAGMLGMVGGALIFFLRHQQFAIAYAGLIAGLWGGFGFAIATFLKLVEVTWIPLTLTKLFGEGTWQTNWHSVLEQTYGFVNGIGIALVMRYLANRLPPCTDEPRVRRWTEVVAVAFVLLLVPYVNFVKNVPQWVRLNALPAELYGIPSKVWFDVGFAILAVAIVLLLARHVRFRLPMVPTDPLGQGQLLYLVFLWWIVLINWMRAIPGFREQRLITEGVIQLNAIACTLLVLIVPRPASLPAEPSPIRWTALLRGASIGLVGLLIAVALAILGTRAIHGDAHVKQASYRPRFGPDAKTGKAEKGKVHP